MLRKLFNIIRNELGDGYGVGSNVSYSWMWGSLSGIFLIIQIVTGLFLSMHYTPEINLAFFKCWTHNERCSSWMITALYAF